MESDPRRTTWGWNAPARIGLIAVATASASALFGTTPGRPTPPGPPPSLKVDPNLVPEAVLGALPGLGPALSGRIVEGRADGPYRSLSDIDRRVKGIGPSKAGALGPYLRFGPDQVDVPR